jgi:hypothetical protein
VVLEQRLQAPALPAGVADALERVIARGTENRLDGGVALVAWRQATSERVAEVKSLTDRCRALIGERDDLRARLDAYAAKAARLGLLERRDVVDAFDRAHGVLYVAPTDLGAAHDVVDQYQRLISALGES